MQKKTTTNIYNIDTLNGIAGNVNTIDNLSIGKNSTNVSNKDIKATFQNKNVFFKQIKFFLYNFLIKKKIFIHLNEKNEIENIKEFEKLFNKAIKFQLEKKDYKFYLKPSRYLKEYKSANSLSSKNEFYKLLTRNNKIFEEIEKIINDSISELLKLYQIYEIKLIIQGLIEFYRIKNESENKISFGFPEKDFYCYTTLDNEEIEELNTLVQREMNMPYCFVDFHTGYDTFHLSPKIRFLKAIPTILLEMYDNNIDFKEIEKYQYQKIGN